MRPTGVSTSVPRRKSCAFRWAPIDPFRLAIVWRLLIADCGLSQVELAIGLARRAEKRR
jgi:hypothetical protein